LNKLFKLNEEILIPVILMKLFLSILSISLFSQILAQNFDDLRDSVQSGKVNDIPRSVFWNMDKYYLNSFIGKSSIVHLGAIGATYLLIESGVDAKVEQWAEKQSETGTIIFSVPGLLGGMLAPAAVPLGMIFFSDDKKIQDAGAAVGQAVLIAWSANTLLKAITGRIPPDETPPEDFQKRSEKFKFGFLRSGVFNGWPSGHAMTNMAMATALATYFHDSPTIQYLAYGWAGYVMISVTVGVQGGVHWISDTVAGGLMGWIIGKTVADGFINPTDISERQKFSLAPILSSNGLQVSLKHTF
jgi:membrane-associated phospholipid phosphatase